MSVKPLRRMAAIGGALVVALTLGACSSATQSGQANHVAPSTQAPSPTTQDSSPTTRTQSSAADSPATSRDPVTVVALPSADPSGVAQGGDADASTGASSAPSSSTQTTTEAPIPPPPPMPPPAAVTGKPKLGSTGIAPIDSITISVTGGTISSLSFTNADGKSVKGSLAKNQRSWTLGEPLGFGKKYTVIGIAANNKGVQTKFKGAYATATTIEPITTTISPKGGAVVGVGAPVIVRFGMNPQDKALVEKHVKITTKPKVEGSWAWITHDGDTYPSLDFRPKNYWPAGTKVHVESDIYGVKFADGWYGGDGASVDFTIGRNRVTYANAKTNRVTVKEDGKTVATYPASLGMGDDPNSTYGLNPNFVTRSGTYIVMNKQQKILMSNPKPGGGWYYHKVPEYWAVRISNNGEFLHYNQGTTAWQLANVNKTHGCINLSEQDARAYYDKATYGDPVVVTGTSVKLSASDGDIHDWAIPWSTWQTLSALSKNSVWG